MTRLFLSIIFLFLAIVSWSQNFVFEKITSREGLSQNDVNAIYQDKNGFLWIGTHDGLNRYDGYNFKTYRAEPHNDKSINSNLIFRISEDIDGNLWIGTSDEGICKLDVKTDKFTAYKNEPQNPTLLSSNQVIKVLPVSDGSVWVGSGRGIDILRFIDGKVTVEKINPENTSEFTSPIINDIEEDVYGRKWVATRDGLFVFSEKDGIYNIKKIPGSPFAKDLCLSDNEAIVSYASGVSRLSFDWDNLTNFRTTRISDANANCILLNRAGNVFIGTNQGLEFVERDKLDKKVFKEPIFFSEGWEANSLSKNVVVSLFEDKSGIIWIGTKGGGLNKYNPKQKKFKHYNKTRIKGSLSYNNIRAIYEDSEKNIWIGTEGGGINFLSKTESKKYDSGWEYFDVNNSLGQNYVYSLIEIDNHNSVEVLAGTGYPSIVTKLRVQNSSPEQVDKGIYSGIQNSPFTFLKTSNGNLWVGTYGRIEGLIRIIKSDEGEKYSNFMTDGKHGSISSNNIRSLLEDSEGNIWIGTDNGLNLLTPDQKDKEKPEFIVYRQDKNNASSISHDYILPMFESKDSTVWIGTMGGGLNRVINDSNPENIKFNAITADDGLPNNVIKGILEDDYGRLWISSNKGLTRYDVKDSLFVNYGISDGLQDYEFGELACCKLSDGEMLFGGVNGFNAFYPKDIITDMSKPEVALTDFHILNRSVAPGEKKNGRVVLQNVINHTDKIRLKYAENSFAIYFSSLHFSAPEKNIYEYMLEGFDNEWIRKDATDRIAKYTNLRPGKYRFKLLASNNDGIWTSDPKVLEVIIIPPWYFSTLAWFVYVLIFLASLWFFQKYSLIRIKQKNELLMEHFEKEKVQELSQMKLRFFTNISHEFRTPLTLIIGPLEKLIRQGSSLSEKKIAESYAIIHRNASILLRLINQLVDFRKFEQGKMILRASNTNIISFLNEIFLSFSELANSKNISYNFSTRKEELNIWFDDDKLERIMYNLLSNAFKFTKENGQIDLIFDEDDNYAIIKVVDDGVGIPNDMQKHIFERFYQAERIKNRKVGSTGIGLSFIKGLIEMHKGEITFESEEDQGTTFILKLKKGKAHLSEEQMRIVTRDVDSTTRDYSFLKPLKISEEEEKTEGAIKPGIVVVEDNFELSQFIKDSLSNSYEIHTAVNGKEGLDIITELNPEVVVSDIMMPVMDGFELCKSIKSDEKISHIPVILLTAKSTAENRIKGYKKGADGYISKPFGIDVLEARIQNLIESREKLRAKLRSTITVEPSEVTTTSMDEKFLKRILRIIEENISNSEFTVEQLASDYGMSQIVLNKKLKGLTGFTAKAFIRSIRLKRAAQLFAKAKYSVTDVTYEVGFSDLKYFRTCFKDEFGMSPSEYSKSHRQE